MKKITQLILALILITNLTACFKQPITHIEQTIPSNLSQRQLSLAEIGKTIIEAGESIGWQMQAIKPGLVRATLDVEQQQAIADVMYTQKNYRIEYRDSQNLGYKSNKISETYNDAVQNLSNAITNALISR